jgi:enamine deaminase RidA (YjgF/YER057c/UK114 family)
MNVECISSPDFPQTMGPYCQATRAGQFIFCAGQGGADPEDIEDIRVTHERHTRS